MEAPAAEVSSAAPTTAVAAAAEAAANEASKLKKVKYAVSFGYCGAHFHGLQTNNDPTHKTIEDELVQAFHRAGLISKDNMEGNTFNKTGWQRASRTDKGVSALRNLISAKLLRQPEGDIACIPRINAELPPAIRIYGLQPVTSSFNSYMHCTGREYEYYLPTYCLLTHAQLKELLPEHVAPLAPSKEMMDADPEPRYGVGDDDEDGNVEPVRGDKRSFDGKNKAHSGAHAPPAGSGEGVTAADGAVPAAQTFTTPGEDGERYYMFRSIPRDVLERMRAHRITPEVLERVRGLFRMFEGTQSFHNFTPRGNPSQPRMTRFIRKVTVSDAFIVKANRVTGETVADDTPASDAIIELEYVRVMLDGQSFMLNQIRKMIGTIITVLGGDLDGGYLRSCLETTVSRGMPMAPANGLFLVNLFFDRYNFSLSRIQSEGSNAAERAPINMSDVNPETVALVRHEVLRSIVREELAHDISGRWMRGLRFVARVAWNLTFE